MITIYTSGYESSRTRIDFVRKRIRSEAANELEESEVKQRTVSHGTFLKWQKELDKEFPGFNVRSAELEERT